MSRILDARQHAWGLSANMQLSPPRYETFSFCFCSKGALQAGGYPGWDMTRQLLMGLEGHSNVRSGKRNGSELEPSLLKENFGGTVSEFREQEFVFALRRYSHFLCMFRTHVLRICPNFAFGTYLS